MRATSLSAMRSVLLPSIDDDAVDDVEVVGLGLQDRLAAQASTFCA